MPSKASKQPKQPLRRCYCRDLSKDISLQIYDSWYTGSPDSVMIEIYLRPNAGRKHRKLIDALFTWSKEQPW
jgi:hypothetical protein